MSLTVEQAIKGAADAANNLQQAVARYEQELRQAPAVNKEAVFYENRVYFENCAKLKMEQAAAELRAAQIELSHARRRANKAAQEPGGQQ